MVASIIHSDCRNSWTILSSYNTIWDKAIQVPNTQGFKLVWRVWKLKYLSELFQFFYKLELVATFPWWCTTILLQLPLDCYFCKISDVIPFPSLFLKLTLLFWFLFLATQLREMTGILDVLTRSSFRGYGYFRFGITVVIRSSSLQYFHSTSSCRRNLNIRLSGRTSILLWNFRVSGRRMH